MAKQKKQNERKITAPPKAVKSLVHIQTRKEHAQEIAQDYVELIAKLIAEKGEARAIDLARCLCVSHVTVGKTIRRLQKLSLVRAPPYSSIVLTKSGEKLAQESRKRHEIVLGFLLALGVPNDIAESDSEGIEHHVSKETLAAFVRFLHLNDKS